MKLSQGEYVALEKVESAYSSSPLIAQIFVHGDSLQDYLVAIVIPDPEYIVQLVKRVSDTHIVSSDRAALDKAVQDAAVKAAIMEELNKQAKKAGLRGFETVKQIHLTMEMFTSDNDTLTPTLKIKRREAFAMYRDVIDNMYKQGLPPSSPKVKL